MPGNPLLDINNLSDVSDTATARENLDVYNKETVDDSSWNGRPGETIIYDTTERLNLDLPSSGNPLSVDVERLRGALDSIDLFASSVLNFLELFVYPESFYESIDGDDWQPALSRANTYSVVNNRTLLIKKDYLLLTTWNIISDSRIFATDGGRLYTLDDTPITLLKSNETFNISIIGLDVDGRVTSATTTKNSTRAIRFIKVNGLSLKGCRAGNSADWCLSVETCTTVRIYDTTIYGGGRGLPGGRDGIHILDGTDVVIDRADIDSGDDCIGITSEYVGTKNITVRRIVGRSDFASLVIYNEEAPGGTYASMPCSNLDMYDLKTKDDAVVRNVVRVIKYGENSVIEDIAIGKVRGESNSHGLYVSGVTKLRHRDIQVHSTQAHGVYISNSTNIEGDAEGKSDVSSTTYQGVSIYNCSYVYAKYSSSNSNGFGVQLNNVSKSVIKLFCLNCGSGLFSSGTGGGARIVNSTNVILSEGILDGDDDVTFSGLNTGGGGNTNIIRGANLIVKENPLPNFGLADGSPVENNIDLNTIYKTTIGRVLATPTNAPTDSGTWFLTSIGYQVGNSSYRTRQILYGYGTSGSNTDNIYTRVYNGTLWSTWKQYSMI